MILNREYSDTTCEECCSDDEITNIFIVKIIIHFTISKIGNNKLIFGHTPTDNNYTSIF